MRELAQASLFHWTPERAIWIGGHTLSWDARCAGIYAGFALAAGYQLAASWRAWRVPPIRILAIVGMFALPLFADVLSIAFGFRVPSNDVRFLTGLLFGAALSIALLPAVLSLAAPTRRAARNNTVRHFAPVLMGVAALFLLKHWDVAIVFAGIEGLCYAGFFALAGLLAAGLFLIVRRATQP